MNMKSKLLAGLGLIAIPLAAQAVTFEQAYVASYRPHKDMPVPVSVMSPTVSSEFGGQELTLKFVVDAEGNPTKITSGTPAADPRLINCVANAVSRWKFNPAYRNGKAVPSRVELPVVILA